MKLLFCGDVVGRSGRDAILEHIPRLRSELGLDAVVVNGENAAAGFGITKKICEDFYRAGVDIITTGNHIWNQKEIISYIDHDLRLLRPMNYPKGTPGRGIGAHTLRDGRQVIVIHVMLRLFMETLDDPFAAVEEAMRLYNLAQPQVAAIILDAHGEASSEKMALAHMVDGRISFVVGTHTHIPTADAQILPKGTAYQTDAGMCGDYNSVIGMKKEIPIARFIQKMPTARFEPAEGEATLCGVYVEIDDKTGLADAIAPVRLGGRLPRAWPLAQDVT
jgi:metallophosphoesterase (TIGR00282 family)